MRKVKCQYCEITDTARSKMAFEMVGKARPVRKYYHKDCYEKYLKEKAIREKEMMEKDELVETLKDIYKIKELPRQVYPLLESLRNGNTVFGRRGREKNKSKEGYTYTVIKETFEYCRKDIEYWNGVKNFKGFMNAFKYGLTIVIDKIYLIDKMERAREVNNIEMKKHIESSTIEHNFESNYKKESDSDSILDFLDD